MQSWKRLKIGRANVHVGRARLRDGPTLTLCWRCERVQQVEGKDGVAGRGRVLYPVDDGEDGHGKVDCRVDAGEKSNEKVGGAARRGDAARGKGTAAHAPQQRTAAAGPASSALPFPPPALACSFPATSLCSLTLFSECRRTSGLLLGWWGVSVLGLLCKRGAE